LSYQLAENATPL